MRKVLVGLMILATSLAWGTGAVMAGEESDASVSDQSGSWSLPSGDGERPDPAPLPDGDGGEGLGGAEESGGGQIVGGSSVSISTRPFQAGLMFSTYDFFCGASVVHPYFLITAAHCVDFLYPDETIRVRVGSGNHTTGGTVVSGTPTGGGSFDSILIHAGWDPFTSDNDLAVIALKTPMPFGSNVQRVRLIETGMGGSWKAGTSATVSGWGTTCYLICGVSEQLRSVSVPVVSDSTCGGGSSYGSDFHKTTMVCAGLMGGGKDSCQGDSGGPLTVGGSGGPFQMGVVSWGIGCAEPSYPGIYTRLANYHATLREIIPLGDNFADAGLITGSGPHLGSTYYAGREASEPVVPGTTTGRSIWYRCLTDVSGSYALNTVGSGYDTTLGVYTGNSLGGLTTVVQNDNWNGVGESRVTFSATEGTVYHIQVGSKATQQGVTALNSTMSCKYESFSDVGRYSSFFEDIEWLVGRGVTEGFSDGTFKPSAGATRQAIAAYLYRYSGSPVGPFPDPGFSDVPPSHPFYTEIAWAADAGVVGGYSDGTFKPTRAVNRQEIAAILHRYDALP